MTCLDTSNFIQITGTAHTRLPSVTSLLQATGNSFQEKPGGARRERNHIIYTKGVK
jgi:hypothetical protein